MATVKDSSGSDRHNPSGASTSTDYALLTMPLEIRLKVLDYLFTHQIVKVESLYAERQEEESNWVMRPIPYLDSQYLRTCRQIYDEANQLLYSSNVFECCAREGMKLLLATIGPNKFSYIKHLVIDWDQLQEFAWSLAKPAQQSATESLEVVEMATWRMRVLGGSSFLWRDVKSNERQICQAALDVCQKHPKLKIVAQKPYHRSAKAAQMANNSSSVTTTHRIKWRFITNEAEMTPEEKPVRLEEELELLKTGGNPRDERGVLTMLDPV